MPDAKQKVFPALEAMARGGLAGAGIGMAAIGAWSLVAMVAPLHFPDETSLPGVVNAASAVCGGIGMVSGLSAALGHASRT